MSYAEEQEQNQSHSKSGKKDGSGSVMCCACHQQQYIPRVALRWTPDGRRKKGRPKETWRRTVEKEMKENSWTWGHLEQQALDRSQWRLMRPYVF